MTQPTLNQVQPVDPILTNFMVGYKQDNMRFVAERVFPSVQVTNKSGTYFVATKKYWFRDDLEVRAPGADFPALEFALSSATFETIQYAGEEKIPDEVRDNSQAPMSLEQMATELLGQRSLIRKERAFATDFMKTGVWGTDDTTTTDWDDFASGDPVNDVLTAKRTISNNTGQDGNTMVLGYIVDQALRLHPDIIDRIKYNQQANDSNIEQALPAVFGVDNYWVSKASYNSANIEQTASIGAIIDDDCLVAYVNPSAGVFGVTAGKTFVWQPGGGAGQIFRVRDSKRHADLIQEKEQWDQKAVATDTGYFFSDVV